MNPTSTTTSSFFSPPSVCLPSPAHHHPLPPPPLPHPSSSSFLGQSPQQHQRPTSTTTSCSASPFLTARTLDFTTDTTGAGGGGGGEHFLEDTSTGFGFGCASFHPPHSVSLPHNDQQLEDYLSHSFPLSPHTRRVSLPEFSRLHHPKNVTQHHTNSPSNKKSPPYSLKDLPDSPGPQKLPYRPASSKIRRGTHSRESRKGAGGGGGGRSSRKGDHRRAHPRKPYSSVVTEDSGYRREEHEDDQGGGFHRERRGGREDGERRAGYCSSQGSPLLVAWSRSSTPGLAGSFSSPATGGRQSGAGQTAHSGRARAHPRGVFEREFFIGDILEEAEEDNAKDGGQEDEGEDEEEKNVKGVYYRGRAKGCPSFYGGVRDGEGGGEEEEEEEDSGGLLLRAFIEKQKKKKRGGRGAQEVGGREDDDDERGPTSSRSPGGQHGDVVLLEARGGGGEGGERYLSDSSSYLSEEPDSREKGGKNESFQFVQPPDSDDEDEEEGGNLKPHTPYIWIPASSGSPGSFPPASTRDGNGEESLSGRGGSQRLSSSSGRDTRTRSKSERSSRSTMSASDCEQQSHQYTSPGSPSAIASRQKRLLHLLKGKGQARPGGGHGSGDLSVRVGYLSSQQSRGESTEREDDRGRLDHRRGEGEGPGSGQGEGDSKSHTKPFLYYAPSSGESRRSFPLRGGGGGGGGAEGSGADEGRSSSNDSAFCGWVMSPCSSIEGTGQVPPHPLFSSTASFSSFPSSSPPFRKTVRTQQLTAAFSPGARSPACRSPVDGGEPSGMILAWNPPPHEEN